MIILHTARLFPKVILPSYIRLRRCTNSSFSLPLPTFAEISFFFPFILFHSCIFPSTWTSFSMVTKCSVSVGVPLLNHSLKVEALDLAQFRTVVNRGT